MFDEKRTHVLDVLRFGSAQADGTKYFRFGLQNVLAAWLSARVELEKSVAYNAGYFGAQLLAYDG
jgi:hypothetical protein